MCKENVKIKKEEEECDILTRIREEREQTKIIQSTLEEINKEESAVEWKSYSY